MKDKHATVIVDLTLSVEELKRRLKKSDRQGINRAIKSGIVIAEVKEDKDWDEFYEIYKKTIVEGGANALPLDELRNRTSNLFLCKKDGKIIAGFGIGFFKIYDMNIPRMHVNASLKEYQNLQSNNLLYWYAILWCKKHNFDRLDLGGWQINARGHLDGVNKFKEKWGDIVYYERDYPFFKAVGRKLVKNSGFFWWLNKKIKHRE